MNALAMLKRWAPALGPAVAVGLAGATSTMRGEVGSANVGAALAGVVVLAALVSRVSGVTTAVAAALAFNLWHTQPYGSLRIDHAGDAAFVALLAVLGFVVGDVRTWQRQHTARRELESERRPDPLTSMISHGGDALAVWHSAVDAAGAGLRFLECRFVPGAGPDLPVIARRGAAGSRVVLPRTGGVLPVRCEGVVVGHLVLVPAPEVAPLELDRSPLLALADSVAIAVSPMRGRGRRWSSVKARD